MAEKPTKQQIAFQQQLNDLYESGAITLKELTSFMADSNKMTASQIRNAKAHFSELKKITKEKEKQLKIEEDLTIANEELIDLASKLNSGIKGNIKEFKTIGDKTADVVGNLKKLIKKQVKSGKLSAKQADEMTVAANEAQQLADSMQVIANSPAAAAMEDLQKAADSAADKIEGLFNKIPGGGMIFRFLGGEELKGRLNKAVKDGVAVMAQKMQEGAKGIDAFKAGFGEFASQVKAIPNIGMVLGIGAVIIAIGALYAIFSSISKEAKKLSEETGVTFSQAKKLNDEARKVQSTYGTQLATMEDITAVQKEQIALLGSAALVNTKIAGSVADTGKAFGYGAEQAGKTHAALMLIGASQQEAADIQLETSAKALKAGVNVAAVQKDISENAGAAAGYFGGSAEALADAAVEAAKLGISIGQMTKIADGLLSIEDSLSKQFRASALIGRQLNFDTARRLALEGNIAGASKEILKELGGIAEFEKMSVVQKKAMADAAGMTVEELTKSMLVQDKLSDLTDDQKAAAANLNMSAAEMGKLNAEQLKNKLAQQQSLDKAGAAFESMKNQLITALLPLAEAFGAVFSLLGPVIKGLGFALKIAFLPLTLITKGFQKIWEFIQSSKEALIAFTIAATALLGVQTAIAFQKKQGLLYDIASVAQGALKFAWTAATGLAESINNKRKKQGLFATLAEMAMKAFTSVASIPIIGPLLGAAAFATAVGLGTKYISKAGDVSSPAKGKTQISTKEGGLFETSKNDDVAAGPGLLSKLAGAASDPLGAIGGLFGGGDGGGGGLTQEQGTTIISLLTQISTNPVPVVIGDTQVSQINTKLSAQNSMQQ